MYKYLNAVFAEVGFSHSSCSDLLPACLSQIVQVLVKYLSCVGHKLSGRESRSVELRTACALHLLGHCTA